MIDFAALEPPSSPNWALVCPPGYCRAAGDRAGAAPAFAASPEAVGAALLEVVQAQPRTRLTARDDAALRYSFTQTSLVFRFVDDIEVQIVPLESGRTSLALYSRSRVGYSDMGVNAKRVGAWMAALSARLPPAQ